MGRLEFLDKARAFAQRQCIVSSSFSAKEFADIERAVFRGESSEEIELYKKALEILVDAAYEIENTFTEVSQDYEEDKG